MKIHGLFIYIFLIFAATGLVLMSCSNSIDIDQYESVAANPNIEPDYSDIVIPPNIAPINFVVQEEGEHFFASIYADSGKVIRIQSKSPLLQIPENKWRALLDANRGKNIHYDVFVQRDGIWYKYQSFTNRVAEEPIDRYLVYRFLRPNYTVQKEMNIRQRDLQSFDESLLMTTKTIAGCINCHSFSNNDPSNMLMHVRWGEAAGTLVAKNGNITKVDTRTEFNQGPGAYPSWHPNGRFVAFSVNKVYQFFHSLKESRDVIDLTSDLILFDTETNTVSIDEKISSPDFMETFPNWSPDGKYLYFCRTPQIKENFDLEQQYRKIKYDLVRIPFNAETGEWGDVETLVSAAKTGRSCSLPRTSPDGKFVLFSMADYGNFPIFRPSSDLYMLSLATKEFERLPINSDAPEGFHCWSSNSRWFVFTSKRDNGVFTRVYFSYVDDKGHTSKAFVLPQNDPQDYQSIFKAFSVPELITKPVKYTPQQFINVALDSARTIKAKLAPDTKMLPKVPTDSSRKSTDFP